MVLIDLVDKMLCIFDKKYTADAFQELSKAL